MKKNVNPGKYAFMKAFLAVPVILGLFTVLGFTKTITPEKMAATAYMPAFPIFYEIYYNDPQDDKVYSEVKTQPEYPGGYSALTKFILDNIKYPLDCKKSGKQGTVLVSFVIDKSGKMKVVKIARSVHPSLDAEAMRIVKKMPAWKPGTDNTGKAVNVSYNLPIKFALK